MIRNDVSINFKSSNIISTHFLIWGTELFEDLPIWSDFGSSFPSSVLVLYVAFFDSSICDEIWLRIFFFIYIFQNHLAFLVHPFLSFY